MPIHNNILLTNELYCRNDTLHNVLYAFYVLTHILYTHYLSNCRETRSVYIWMCTMISIHPSISYPWQVVPVKSNVPGLVTFIHHAWHFAKECGALLFFLQVLDETFFKCRSSCMLTAREVRHNLHHDCMRNIGSSWVHNTTCEARCVVLETNSQHTRLMEKLLTSHAIRPRRLTITWASTYF